MRHTCHAHDCDVPVPPSMFMCKRHWYKLSKPVRDAVWREYVPGQEDTKTPSRAYLAVQRYAVSKVAFMPNDEVAAYVAAGYLAEALILQQACIKDGEPDPLRGLR